MKYYIHSYRRSRNVGDAIQTIALQRLLPTVEYTLRQKSEVPEGSTLVVNGWLGANHPPVSNRMCLFAGVFVNDNEENFRWMKNSIFGEVGVRDPVTAIWCADRKIPARFIGCATLTLERYTGARSGVFAVDHSWKEIQSTSHRIGNLSWEDQLSDAMRRLSTYRTAEMVVTSRLHVALPCLAFGTPVIIKSPIGGKAMTIRRFSILDALGVRYGVPQSIDVSNIRNRYIEFLQTQLGIQIKPNLLWKEE